MTEPNTIAPTVVAIEKAYPVTLAGITAMVSRFTALGFETPERYEEGKGALRSCLKMRTAIEARRKELKSESLEYGRRVDAVARQLTEIIDAVETPLKALKQGVDDEAARIKAEAAAEKRRLERAAIEAEIAAKFEAERAEREAAEAFAREKRLADAAAEQQRRAIEAEERRINRIALEAAQQRLAAEQARLDAERAAHDAELADFRRAKAAAEAEQRAKELAEQRIAKERQAELDRLEFEAEQLRRREALRPDVEKIHAWGAAMTGELREVPYVADAAAQAFVRNVTARLEPILLAIQGWQP